MVRKVGLYNWRAHLDAQLTALSNRKRRDILMWLSERKSSNLKNLAAQFDISITAAAKHTDILYMGGLVAKNRAIKSVMVEAVPGRLLVLKKYLNFYKDYWIDLDSQTPKIQITDETADIWRHSRIISWRRRR